MNQKFNLAINKPCSEKFDSFQSTTVGGFCSSCQKEVIDFTVMSEQEILQYFINKPQNACGLFHKSQLKTYSETPKSKKKWNLLGAGLLSFSLISMLPVNHSLAQTVEESKIIETSKKKNNNKQNTDTKPSNDNDHLVEGIVTDETGLPLPGTSIWLKDSDIGTLSDIDGKFKFPQPLKAGDTLVFSYVGYEIKYFIVPENATSVIDIKIKFKESDEMLMGDIVVEEVYTSKRSFWQKVKGIFK